MQWESGRTRRTLLQVVRESKEKGGPHSTFFQAFVPKNSVLTNWFYSSLPMLPQLGLELCLLTMQPFFVVRRTRKLEING